MVSYTNVYPHVKSHFVTTSKPGVHLQEEDKTFYHCPEDDHLVDETRVEV